MRTWMLTISTLLLSGLAVAQTPIPGTFNNTPPQTTQQTNGSGNNGGYIVSPPTISLGNGITPTVVSNQDSVNITGPQNTSLNGQAVQANNPATVNDNGGIVANADNANSGAVNNQASANGQNRTTASRNYDFARAPSGESGPITGSMSDDSISLGEVARKARNGKQIAKRTITNADVNALNAQYPGDNNSGAPSANANDMAGTSIAGPASQQNSANGSAINGINSTQNNGGTAGAAQPQSSSPAYAQPSSGGPFAPRATPNDGTKPNAQQGPGVSPRRSSRPASAPNDQSTPTGENTKPQLPRSSTSLPLLGTLGALSTLAGICYFKMR